jgi:uncharacterized MAPEG superfamily protein
MTRPLLCLIGFAAWGVLLVLAIGAVRVIQVLTGKKRPNEFPGGVPHGGDSYWRLNRAHVNTMENLPIFASLVLVGTVARVATPSFETLPVVVLGARLAQSAFHISSGRSLVVNFRFTAYLTQLACFIWMMVEILRAV